MDGSAAPQVAGGRVESIVSIGVCFRVVFERAMSRFWVSAAFPRHVLTDLLHRLRQDRRQRFQQCLGKEKVGWNGGSGLAPVAAVNGCFVAARGALGG